MAIFYIRERLAIVCRALISAHVGHSIQREVFSTQLRLAFGCFCSSFLCCAYGDTELLNLRFTLDANGWGGFGFPLRTISGGIPVVACQASYVS
jgi:hypothetical protein